MQARAVEDDSELRQRRLYRGAEPQLRRRMAEKGVQVLREADSDLRPRAVHAAGD
jgi:hypothetical protein